MGKLKKISWLWYLVLLFAFLIVFPASAGPTMTNSVLTLSVDDTVTYSDSTGKYIYVPVNLVPQADIAGVDLKVAYDPAQYQPVATTVGGSTYFNIQSTGLVTKNTKMSDGRLWLAIGWSNHLIQSRIGSLFTIATIKFKVTDPDPNQTEYSGINFETGPEMVTYDVEKANFVYYFDNNSPTSFNITSAIFNSSMVDLSWSASRDDRGEPGLLGYRIYRDGKLIAITTGTSYTDQNPGADLVISNDEKSVKYKLEAVDYAGNFTISNQMEVAVTDTRAPTPSSLVYGVYNPALRALEVKWLPASDDLWIRDYDLKKSQDRNSWQTIGVRINGTAFSDNNVNPSGYSYYLVTARDGAGKTADSAAWLVDWLDPQITSLNAVYNVSQRAVNLSWAATDNFGISVIDVYRSQQDKSWQYLANVAGQSSAYTDLTPPASNYAYYKIIASDNNGNSASKEILIDWVPPTQPANLTALYTSGKVNLNWSPSTDNHSVEYDVFRGLDTKNWTKIATISSPSYIDNSPDPHNYSFYSVVARDPYGNLSSRSNEALDDWAAPDKPSGFTLRSENGIFKLAWSGFDNYMIDRYEIWLSTTGDNGPFSLFETTRQSVYNYDSKGIKRDYTFYIISIDTKGKRSEPSSNQRIQDQEPPTTPQNLVGNISVSGKTYGISLSWNSTDFSGIKGYNLYRAVYNPDSGVWSNWQLMASPGESRYLDYNISEHTSYKYQVEAFDIFNNMSTKSSESNQIDIPYLNLRRISGTVIDGAYPISGASVWAGSKNTVTDAQGNYTIDIIPGTYFMGVSHPRYKGTERTITIGQNNETVDFSLDLKKATITGAVYQNGIGLKGVEVFAVHDDDYITARTDDSGSYTFYLEYGSYTLGASSSQLPGIKPDGPSSINVDRDYIAGVNFTAPRFYNIRGTVSLNGQALARVPLYLSSPETKFSTQTQTGNNGQFALQGVNVRDFTDPLGTRYKLQLKYDGLTKEQEIFVRNNDLENIDFALTNLVTLSGAVYSPSITGSLNRVPNAIVAARTTSTYIYSAYTDPNGSYRLQLLPYDNYQITSFAIGLGRQTRPASVLTNTYGFEIFYPSTSLITGRVVFGGMGIPNATVNLSGVIDEGDIKQAVSNEVITDILGNYSFEVRSGKYYITTTANRMIMKYYAPELQVGAGVTQPHDIEMEEPLTEIKGKVLDQGTADNGPGLSGVMIWAKNDAGGYISTTTDNKGAYSLKVTHGTWYLTFKLDWFEDHSLTVDAKNPVESRNAKLKKLDFTGKPQEEQTYQNQVQPTIAILNPQDGGVLEDVYKGVQVIVPPGANPGTTDVKLNIRITNSSPATNTAIPIKTLEVKAYQTTTYADGTQTTQVITQLQKEIEMRISYNRQDLEVLKTELVKENEERQKNKQSQIDIPDDLNGTEYEASLRISYLGPNGDWITVPNAPITDDGANDSLGYFLVMVDHYTKFALVKPKALILRAQELPPEKKEELRIGGYRTNVIYAGYTGIVQSADNKVQLIIVAGSIDQQAQLSLSNIVEDLSQYKLIETKATNGTLLTGYNFTIKDNFGQAIPTLIQPNQVSIDVGVGYDHVGLYRYDPIFKTLVPLMSQYDATLGTVKAEIKIAATYVAVAEETKTFQDLPAKHWAAKAVELLNRKNILDGVSSNSFAPQQNLTRGQVAKIMALLTGVPGTTEPPQFKDLQADKWSTVFVTAAKKEGLVGGYSDGSYKPEQAITRAELAKLVVMAAKINMSKNTPNKFKDLPAKHWAIDYLQAAIDARLLSGYPDHTLRPDAKVNRAEATALIANAFPNLLN